MQYKNKMIEIAKIDDCTELPDWLLEAENEIFGNYLSCPKTKKAQQEIYPFPGKIYSIKDGTSISSFLYSYSMSSNAEYIWALGTLPKYRRKGHFSELISVYYDKIEINHSVFFVSANSSIKEIFISAGFKKIQRLNNTSKKLIEKFNCKLIGKEPEALLEGFYLLNSGAPVNAYFFAYHKESI